MAHETDGHSEDVACHSQRVCVFIVRVSAFPVSNRGSPFFTMAVLPALLSRFLSCLRERNSGAAGLSLWVRAVSRQLSACVPCPPRVLSSRWYASHRRTSTPLLLRAAWSLLALRRRTSVPMTRCPWRRQKQ